MVKKKKNPRLSFIAAVSLESDGQRHEIICPLQLDKLQIQMGMENLLLGTQHLFQQLWRRAQV